MRGTGIGFGLARCADAAPVPVFSNDNIADWIDVGVLHGGSPTTDPETGAAAYLVDETATTGNHYIFHTLALDAGDYRLRVLLKQSGRTRVSIDLNIDGFQYWIGDINTGLADLASGLAFSRLETLANGMYALNLTFSVVSPAGQSITIGCSLVPSNTSYLGVPGNGIIVGNVKIYEA